MGVVGPREAREANEANEGRLIIHVDLPKMRRRTTGSRRILLEMRWISIHPTPWSGGCPSESAKCPRIARAALPDRDIRRRSPHLGRDHAPQGARPANVVASQASQASQATGDSRQATDQARYCRDRLRR